MAVPFGFSAGDFVAALHLLNKAVSALRDSDGASSHFKHTILELEGLCFVLQRVQAIEPADPASPSFQKLQFFGHQCYIPLDAFFRKIRDLVPDLGDEGIGDEKSRWQKCVKRPARQIQWTLQLQKHLSTLKAAITPQLGAIEILLQLIHVEQQNKLQESHDRFAEAVLGLVTTIQSRSDAVDARLESLSKETSMDIAIRSLETLRSDICTMNAQVSSRLDSLRFNTSTEHIMNVPGARLIVPEHATCQNGPEHSQKACTKASQKARRLPVNSRRKPISMDTTIRDIVQILRDGVDALLLRVWIFLAIFQTALHNMKIISRLPTMLLSSNISFRDVLGRHVSLPFEHFKHLPVFLARLDCEFRDIPRYHRVFGDQFHLVLGIPGHPIRNESKWNKLIKPGAKIRMFVIFEKNEPPCPMCKAFQKTKRVPLKTTHCTQCHLGYAYQEYRKVYSDFSLLPHTRSPRWAKEELLTSTPDYVLRCSVRSLEVYTGGLSEFRRYKMDILRPLTVEPRPT